MMPAVELLLITRQIRAPGILPFRIAARMAPKFDPRPDPKTAMFSL
jgi:hypothetical protein